MRIKLFESIKHQLQQLVENIHKPNNENENLDYLYTQAYDQSTSIKGEDYSDFVHNLFGGRGNSAIQDLAGGNKRERCKLKAVDREATLKIEADNITQTITNAEFAPDQLQELEDLAAQTVIQLKQTFTFKQTQDAIDRLYQPINNAINSELQFGARFSM